MVQELVLLIGQYGLALVFVNVLLEQVGLPVPAIPTLIVAGAALAAYIAFKWWERRKFYRMLRMARISVDELYALVLYCTCPNEAGAAQVAKLLVDRGFHRVRPLHGGLDAWIAAGYEVETKDVINV